MLPLGIPLPPIRTNFPWLVSSPFSLRPGTHRPFLYEPSSIERTPAIGGPGVFGENVTVAGPLPAMMYSSGATEMKIAPAGVDAGGGVAGRLLRG